MIFLLPPSEWKLQWWNELKSSITRTLPIFIAENASEKDLKCIWKRYEEGIHLNKSLSKWPFMNAIERYSWVMFKAISYESLHNNGKLFFDKHVMILSGLYWLIKPKDKIANYKLPVDAKWLRQFWWKKITEDLLSQSMVVDLLPLAHKKLINFDSLSIVTKVIHVDFFLWEKKMTHWVKWAKWYWLHMIAQCWSVDVKSRANTFDYKDKQITVKYS